LDTTYLNASAIALPCWEKLGYLPDFTEAESRLMSFFVGSAGQTQGEYCLGLNVWTKSNTGKENVVGFMYGGGEFQ
jgi:carboxylesterase type B